MDGILVINKEKGYTSHDVIVKVKKICNIKVGHIGTLDPLATGVLPLLLGKATKLSQYLIEHDKVYEVILQLGIKTDTGDVEGNKIEEKKVLNSQLDKKNILKILKSFIGLQIQKPPIYSAIKIKGKKLYEYARKGEKVDIPEREIEIYKMKLKHIDMKNKTIDFKVHCSKGTYIRSLCEDIAEKLDTVGYMKELKRTRVGKFTIEESITIQNLEKSNRDLSFWKKYFITIQDFFKNEQEINLDDKQLRSFLNGVKLNRKEGDGFYRINSCGKFVGMGFIENSLLKRELIL